MRRLLDTVVAAVALAALGPFAWRRAARRPAESEPHERIYGLQGRVFLRRGSPEGTSRLPETLGHVLRGDLALVGPRPVSPEKAREREEIRVLFDLVRPGATGLWRVHESESLTREEELSLALSYLQNQSPLEDLKTILRSAVSRPGPRN